WLGSARRRLALEQSSMADDAKQRTRARAIARGTARKLGELRKRTPDTRRAGIDSDLHPAATSVRRGPLGRGSSTESWPAAHACAPRKEATSRCDREMRNVPISHALMRWPVLKTHQITTRQAVMNRQVMPRLTVTL